MSSDNRWEIRRARVADAQDICTMWIRSIREVCGPLYGNDEKILSFWCSNKTESNLIGAIEDALNYAIVAVDASQHVMGIGILRGSDIRACYLAPEYLSLGVGKQLLLTLEAEARRRGISKLSLGSTRYALPFYLRNGFQLLSETELLTNSVLPYYPMEKSLSEPAGT